jgi:hypothetical protein
VNLLYKTKGFSKVFLFLANKLQMFNNSLVNVSTFLIFILILSCIYSYNIVQFVYSNIFDDKIIKYNPFSPNLLY